MVRTIGVRNIIAVDIAMIMMTLATVGLNSPPDNLISHGSAMINTFHNVGITMSLYDHQALPHGEKFVKAEQEDEFL